MTPATVALEQWRSITLLAAMTLGTDQGTWWGDPEFGSRLWVLRQSGKVDEAMVQAVKAEVVRALGWMKDGGLISVDPAVEAWQNGRNRIDYRVRMTRPTGVVDVMEGVWYGL